MQGNCHKAAEIDLAAFLAESSSPAWEEFRQHYLECESCSTEVYKWAKLDRILRTMSRETAVTHPSEERLVQFQQSPGNLASEERRAMQQHLQTCSACREELSFLASFDFSLVQRWVDEEKRAREGATGRRVLKESFMARIARWLDPVRSLVLHPVFAYGVALLLLVFHPLSGSSGRWQPVSMRAGTERNISSVSTETIAPPHLSPHEAASVLLGAYKAAYEARDIGALDRLWKQSGEWRTEAAQLFEESRRLSLLFAVRSIRANDEGNQALVDFAQVTTVLSKDGRFYTKGPVSYIAELRRHDDSSGWKIQDLQRVPD